MEGNEEQQSFQALKSKWAQQSLTKQEQSANTSPIISPPPIPPKPALHPKPAVDVEAKGTDREVPSKRVSTLTNQFETVNTPPGNFSNSQSPHHAAKISEDEDDPFYGSSDGDSDIEEDDDEENEEANMEGDTSLIQQVQKAHLQYTKLEEPRFVGAPGARSQDNLSVIPAPSPSVSSSSIRSTNGNKRPPPPPPPSRKYHNATKPISHTSICNGSIAPPIVQSPAPPPPVVDIPLASEPSNPSSTLQLPIAVEAVNVSPPVLPPRPTGSPLMPQLPPRPSQSTLARAHTIASAPHPKPLAVASFESSAPVLGSVEVDDNALRIRRANTTSTNKQRAMSRSELLITSSTCPDFSKATRNAPLIVLEKPFSTGHRSSLNAVAVTQNVLVTGASSLRTWDVHTGTVISTILTEGSNNNGGNSQNSDGGDRVRALAVAPSRIPADEGRYVWVARNDNSISVIDIRGGGAHKVLSKRHDVHMTSINFLLRYGNSEIWSIDDSGILNVWDVISSDYHAQQNPLLTAMPRRYHVTAHAVAATIYGSKLWMSSGRTLAAHTIPGILQSASFPRRDYADVFVHGGDGAMILDHEFCFLSGDLNYRIKMARKDVLRILANNNKKEAWEKLQEQDQLLRQKINNPLFKLLTFEEAPIQFDPTYKYDPGTDFYDSSEKKRVPAWCDRILYKGKNIQNLFYRRYEPRCSDHRPIAAGFSFETKITDQKKRDMLMSKVEEEWREHVERFIKDKKARYVADYEMCSLSEAFTRLEKSDWDVNDTVIKLLGEI
ncbi:putative inositol polyphosphate 5-phosphatase C9G1.10c, partial [Choanephora cucurbitarum]